MDISHLLNRTLDVWRPTMTDDGHGGQDITLVHVGTAAAKVDQPSAADRMLAAQSGAAHTHTVYLQPAADVHRGDQLRGDGQNLTVHTTVQPSTPIYTKADCELTQTEGG